MNKRKDLISSLKICRFCLTQDVPMSSLYDKKRKIKNSVNLPLKILSCVSVEVFPSDKMPTYICVRCNYFMNVCYNFKHICRQADEAILRFVQDNKPFKPITWPMSLNDIYRESNDIGVMKTVVEDGTTVQVSHDISDSEDEEDENVYNVKISDGPDEVSKTCVKVIASRDNEEKPENKGTSDGCWACDECDCTYPLQQLLELHKAKKHRQRDVSCDQCDDKFFTKYDLAIHRLRHSEDMPYECVACGKKFKRIILLKRHEKLIHADLAQQVCPHCPASFLSCDELEAHQKKHEKLSLRSFSCSLCKKKFLDNSTLQRHVQLIHERELNFACEYCPQRYASVTKLSSHVRTHAGERPYPCKYCDKSFMKSHHHTRHVRMKHRVEDRGRSGADSYRCEQCEISFTNQDELIYHSAIHATQNLTCPLCQEKFANVDEVTSHIKSHVNGMEFMCDFCELVFTTKEKLDNHTMLSHEEEVQNELGQDESSMEADDIEAEVEADADAEEDEDNCINVKEEGDHMVIEIKKADEFMLKERKAEVEEKKDDHCNSEESDSERTYLEQTPNEKYATVKKVTPTNVAAKEIILKPLGTTLIKSTPQGKVASEEKIVHRKTEEIKRAPIPQRPSASNSPIEKKEKLSMVQVTKIETGNDKSLRLLEKELQDLKRTNSRSEAVKTPPVKTLEAPRGRGRPALYASTPKIKKGIYRPTEDKKTIVITKMPLPEKKQVEKKVITKENKEPKVVKEPKTYNSKEDMDTNKNVVKNGTNEKSGSSEDGIRRSTRPSKIKDYAKMIRLNTQENSDSDELDNDDDEYRQGDKSVDSQGRVRARRNSVRPHKSSPAPVTPVSAPATPLACGAPAAALSTPIAVMPPRKRGRPRKEQPKEIPAKIKKTDAEAETEHDPEAMSEPMEEKSPPETAPSGADTKQDEDSQDSIATEPEPEAESKLDGEDKLEEVDNLSSEEQKSPNEVEQEAPPPNPTTLISPTGQTLKKIPIRSLPPGVKPLPLPMVGRNIPPGELCQMQIGKKVVKVQKIVMTKAEVEAMAKQGLVEMKDGTMVLKPGVKIAKTDPVTGKPVVAEGEKEASKKDKATPTRCNIGAD